MRKLKLFGLMVLIYSTIAFIAIPFIIVLGTIAFEFLKVAWGLVLGALVVGLIVAIAVWFKGGD